MAPVARARAPESRADPRASGPRRRSRRSGRSRCIPLHAENPGNTPATPATPRIWQGGKRGNV